MREDRGSDVKLGEPVDLWAGLEPRFVSSGRPWRLPEGRPVRTELPGIPSDPVEWGLPSLSLHENVADLLSHIFDYSASPMVGLDGPHAVTAGALMAGKSLAELEGRLKLDLTIRPAPAFLLVRLTGSRGTSYYPPEWQGLNRKTRIIQWLTPEGRAAMARLRLREMRDEGHEFYGDITARQARRYLGYFQDMGTHIVRSISYGECLFQVFEASGDLLPGLKDFFAGDAGHNQVSGPLALGMAHLTRPPWVTGASPILSASESESARQVAHHEIWTSDRPGEPPSLLSREAMPAWRRTAVLNMLPAQAVVGVSFACQALYLEDYRADAWNRIMRAGLCQQFPAVRLSGWRARDPFPLASFLASAALAGEEALCKPAAPVLPETALALDVTAPGRILNPQADCLAFFAATNPGTGRAAEHEIDSAAFDPSGLNIPFLDGALCLTDREGERSCLVEGVWLGRTEGGRPGIKGAPAEPDEAVLAGRALQLAAYLRLMGQLQGSGVLPGAGAAMRRSAAWLAEATSPHPHLVRLRWQALQVARGAGQIEPGILLLDRALESALAQLLGASMDLLALPANGTELGAAAEHMDRRLRAFYGRLPSTLEAAELDRRSLAAGEALQRRFAGFGKAPDLPERAAALFAAGAALCLPPDLHRIPHGVVPGDGPPALFWNALLGMRARYAECRAILLAVECRTAEAADLLEHEIIGSNDGPSDPAGDVLAALDALPGALIEAADRDMLQAEMAELLELCRAAHLLQLASGGGEEGSAETGPQLHRLLILLEVLQLCRAANIPLAALDSLAPAAFAARIEQALMAIAGHRRSA